MVNMAAAQMGNAAAMANSTTKTRFKAFKRTKSTLPRNMEYYVNKRRLLKQSCAAEAQNNNDPKQLMVVGRQQS